MAAVNAVVVAVCVLVAVVVFRGEAGPDGSGKRLCQQSKVALDLNPADLLEARRLYQLDPAMSKSQLAGRIPLTDLQKDLLRWMYDDLVQYRDQHGAVWADRREKRKVGDGLGDWSPLRPLHEDLEATRRSVQLFHDRIQDVDVLTVRDFHYLVSVFALPDETDETRFVLDVTNDDDDDGGRSRRGVPYWSSYWPQCWFLFTTMELGFRRLALSFRQPVQYVGLVSHLAPAWVHGQYYFPADMIRHDLFHCKETRPFSKRENDLWRDVHEAYAAIWPPHSKTVEAKMCDIVYFMRTHEDLLNEDANVLFRVATKDIGPWLRKIGGDDAERILIDSIQRVSAFLQEMIPSLKDKQTGSYQIVSI